MKRYIVISLGWLFLVLGFLGLFLPILQGILFLIIGLLLLSTEYEWAQRLVEKITVKYPRIGGVLRKARGYVDRLIAKIENLGKKRTVPDQE